MRVTLVSRDNGVGLSTDVELLRDWLAGLGHDVSFVDWHQASMSRCDVAIFIELINPRLMPYARHRIGIFNLEWFEPSWRKYLGSFTQIWARSLESLELYQRLGVAATFTGFLGRDMLDSSIQRRDTCLHLRGKSGLKGTEAVLAVWAENPDLPQLTIISHQDIDAPGNVRVLPRIGPQELRDELNAHSIHICPSASEGWGHHIAEGLSVGAVIVASDASPMNEHVGPGWGFLVPTTPQGKHGLADRHVVAAPTLHAAVSAATALPAADREAMGALARGHFEARNNDFRQRAGALLRQLARTTPVKPATATMTDGTALTSYTSRRVVRVPRAG